MKQDQPKLKYIVFKNARLQSLFFVSYITSYEEWNGASQNVLNHESLSILSYHRQRYFSYRGYVHLVSEIPRRPAKGT